MPIHKLFLILGCLILIVSCKKELPFPNSDSAPFLVINSLFSPDSLLQVHISESCHVNDPLCNYSFITEAEVLLRDQSGNVIANLEHQGDGFYSPADFILNNQADYQIEVNHSNRSATAECQIPKAFSCTYLGKQEEVFDGSVAWAFDVEIVDNPDEENYYLLEGYIEILDGEHSSGVSETNGYIEPHSAHLTNDVNAENNSIASGFDITTYALRSIFLPDDNFNGTTYQTRFAIRDEDVLFSGFEEFKAHLFIKSVSKEMYEYHQSLERYRLGQHNLFAEPEKIYSNIEGGLGIFAGYTQQTFTIDLPVSEYRFPGNIFVENDGCTAPCTIKFTTDGGSKLSYNWNFGDGSTSTEANPEHSYESAGEYNVELILIDSPGNIYSYGTHVKVN